MPQTTDTHPRATQGLTSPVAPSSGIDSPVVRRVAYVMSRFPKLTETFVLYEMMAMERLGLTVDVYPLLRARNTSSHPEGASFWQKAHELFRVPNEQPVMHVEAAPFVARAHYLPFFSREILAANLVYLLRRPWRYLSALATLLWANLGSANYWMGNLALFPKTVCFARRMVRAGVQHVHAHFANHPAAAAFVIHRLTDIPYTFTAHGADLQVDQHMLREKVQSAAKVVAISDYNQQFIVGICGEAVREKVEVVHCGVDTQFFHPPPGEPPGSGPLRILCVGTFYEVKGHPYLIEACRLLRDAGLDFVCRLVGDGPDRERLADQVAQASLEGRVLFEGQKTREEIRSLHWQSDVLVAPSVPTTSGRREGIPVVLMEAMASGLPVVASRISGIPELVEDNVSGRLVPPREPSRLAEALMQLSADQELRRRLGRAGRQTIELHFDQTRNANRLASLFGRSGAAP